jgi:hypothetical protein
MGTAVHPFPAFPIGHGNADDFATGATVQGLFAPGFLSGGGCLVRPPGGDALRLFERARRFQAGGYLGLRQRVLARNGFNVDKQTHGALLQKGMSESSGANSLA